MTKYIKATDSQLEGDSRHAPQDRESLGVIKDITDITRIIFR